MRVSLNWLKEFVDFTLTPKELSHLLTMAGLEVEELEEYDDDTILEISITPNRADCLSIIGIAREISANLQAPMKQPSISVDAEDGDGPTIEIEDVGLCHRYASRIIYGVKVGPSPEWISRRLESHGLRAINNIVDITNYVLLEMGHPLHAFDLDRLSGKKIVVKKAGTVSSFITLDGEERALNNEMLLIWDSEKPVAIAGVMGGLNSEVIPSTVNVLLESAYFEPVSVRKTSKALNLTTDASYRFERGTDIDAIVSALNRTTMLIKEVAGGSVTRLSDNYPIAYKPPQVYVRFQRIKDLLGVDIDEVSVERILKRLGFIYRREGEGVVVIPPSFRRDIQRDVDIIEEVARLYGYDRIPATMPAIQVNQITNRISIRTVNFIKEAMVKSGFTEVVNLSFLSPLSLDSLNIPEGDRRRRLVFIRNPLRKEESALRTTLIPSLLNNARLNQSRGERAFSLFEISNVFFNKGDKLPDEVMQMAAIHCRASTPSIWQKAHDGFYDVKGAIENLFDGLKISDYSFEQSDSTTEPYLHPTKSCVIKINGQEIGSAGELHPVVASAFELRGDISLFEINNLYLLLRAVPSKIRFRPLPRYPYIERDISIVVQKEISVAQIKKIISDIDTDIIESVELFDIYTGKQIPADKKSIAFSIRYRAAGRTLTDSEVDAVHSKMISRLRETVKAELRS